MKTTCSRPCRRVLGLLAALSMTVVLAACSGSGGDDLGGGDSADGRTERSFGTQESEESAARDTASATSPSSNRSSSNKASKVLDRAVISHGTVSLVADDVTTARQDVQRVLDAQGGSVSEEQAESDKEGELTYTRLVVRVPAKAFAATMSALEDVATFRTSNRGSEDVTTEVIDNDVRVRAQQASLRRVEALLARADSLKDIIWIESQLTQRQAELDSLKSQQTWLTDQTTMSTITVDITAKPEPKEKKAEGDDGFLAGLAGGWSALSGTATVLATVVGALLPFALVALLLGGPAWWLARRARARRRTPDTSQA